MNPFLRPPQFHSRALASIRGSKLEFCFLEILWGLDFGSWDFSHRSHPVHAVHLAHAAHSNTDFSQCRFFFQLFFAGSFEFEIGKQSGPEVLGFRIQLPAFAASPRG